MMPKHRAEILRGIESVCRLFPALRLCQMVSNLSILTMHGPEDRLADVTDEDFVREMWAHIRRRIDVIGHEPIDALEFAHPNDTWTLPPQLAPIVQGLKELSERYPDQPFVSLVLQVAEWAKEYSPFDFWDVEDADFLRAIQAHLTPSGVIS
jgi:hypothetical protein